MLGSLGQRFKKTASFKNTPNREPFQHSPLSENSTRILSLAPGKWNDPIVCSLKHIDLEGGEKYEALSYTWGTKTTTRQIQCNGKTFEVTSNLLEALKYLRRHDTERRLWIDQIGINQKDVHEKNIQVPLMGKIYSTAEKVLIWLGSPDEDSEFAINLARRIIKIPSSSWDAHKDIIATLKAFELPEWRHKSWMKFASLFLRPYFSRAWTVQEAAYASSIEVILGKDSFQWAEWTLLRERTEYVVNLNLDLDAPSSLWIGNGTVTVDLINKYRTCITRGYPIPAREVMNASLTLRASDPRDLVYAFSNLNPFYMEVDYSKPYHKIFTDFLLHHVFEIPLADVGKRKHSVDPSILIHILHRCEIVEHPAGLPGWIPDWSKDYRRRPILCSHGSCFQTGGEQCGQLTVTEGVTLLLEGKQYDVVRKAGRLWFDSDDITNSVNTITAIESWFAESASLQVQLPLVYPTGEMRNDVYKRSLFTNHVRRNCSPHMGYVDELYRWMHQFFGHGRSTKSAFVMFKDYQPFFSEVTSQLRRRVFFITEKGYMGIGPLGTKPGSRVCALRGFKVPFVMNELLSRRYRVLGDGYVHGIMGGEVLQDLTIPLETFELV